jgi:hypothetical protein
MLKPEVPTILANGDVVTFGKSVGKDSHTVHPVVVRIGLLYDPQPQVVPSSSAHVLPTLPPFIEVPSKDVSDDADSPELSKQASKQASGRYGVYVPSSPESDDSFSKSGHDSDVEELDGPPESSESTSKAFQVAWDSHIKNAFHFLKAAPPFERIPPIINIESRSQSPWVPYDPYSPSFSPRCHGASPSYSNFGFDAYSNDIFEDRSKSTSPMDLSSPSPAPSEPKVIETWRSPSASSEINGQPENNNVDGEARNVTSQDIDKESDGRVEESNSKPMSTTSVEAQPSQSREPSQALDGDVQCEIVRRNTTEEVVPRESVHPDVKSLEEKLNSDISAMQSSLANLQVCLSKTSGL